MLINILQILKSLLHFKQAMINLTVVLSFPPEPPWCEQGRQEGDITPARKILREPRQSNNEYTAWSVTHLFLKPYFTNPELLSNEGQKQF